MKKKGVLAAACVRVGRFVAKDVSLCLEAIGRRSGPAAVERTGYGNEGGSATDACTSCSGARVCSSIARGSTGSIARSGSP
jgi:hypothetical protein